MAHTTNARTYILKRFYHEKHENTRKRILLLPFVSFRGVRGKD